MKIKIQNIIVALSILAIGSAAAAYVKVYVMENDIEWIKGSLTRIESRLGTN